MSEKCRAANDKLLPDMLSVEVYECDLDLGHLGPHKSLGHPIWWDESSPKDQFGPPNLAERALKAMLPPDALVVSLQLEGIATQYEDDAAEVVALNRAAAILRGEP